MVFPYYYLRFSAYKDPAENQHVRKFFDQMIPGFFVTVFGIIWFCTTRYNVKPKHYTLSIYDVFGNQVTENGIRRQFHTKQAAQSFMLEYQKRFPLNSFSINLEYKNRIEQISNL